MMISNIVNKFQNFEICEHFVTFFNCRLLTPADAAYYMKSISFHDLYPVVTYLSNFLQNLCHPGVDGGRGGVLTKTI